jgi:hypothetical protein
MNYIKKLAKAFKNGMDTYIIENRNELYRTFEGVAVGNVIKDFLCAPDTWESVTVYDKIVIKFKGIHKDELQREIYEWLKLRVEDAATTE